MSFLSDFEERMGAVFGAAPQGYTEPFSFKKLAKRAAREMENETFEIDGTDTAPALYTVLVSASDDSLMRPLYAQITYEIAAFVTAQAQKKGYAFVGNPLVRFMVDPSLKSGKFAIFAENVDAVTLERLRAEEQAFLGESSSLGGAAAQLRNRTATPRSKHAAHSAERPMPVVAPSPDPEPSTGSATDAGLDVIPADYAAPNYNEGLDFGSSSVQVAPAPASASTPMPVASAPLVAPAPVPGAVPVPQTQLKNVPLVGMPQTVPAAAPAAQPAAPTASCMLIDRQTGRTYTVGAPTAVIGRERAHAQVVLRDPNVSREHARLSYDGRNWNITDLNSTNGTLVNDVDIRECSLRDGDLITLGLVNLEFRENLQ